MKEQDKVLFDAIENGDLEQVRKALENGADIDAVNDEKQTPAEYAASIKEYSIAEIISHKDDLVIELVR